MAKGQKPSFNYDLCVACHICEQVCAFSSISLTKEGVNKKYKKVYPELTSPETCTGCGQCSRACPVKAIEVK